jgi:predicted dehydrogenase
MKSFGLLLVTGNQTHQENYARAFAADPRCRLVGLTDEATEPRRTELNRELAEELKIPFLENFSAAVRQDDVDFVSICSEPERRLKLTLECIEAGKHLYLDKDPAPTVDAARQIAEAASEKRLLSQSFSLIRVPAAAQAKAALESGELGDLHGIHCDITFAKGQSGTATLGPREEKPDPTRFSFFDSKREFLCVGWYALAFFSWLTGKKAKSVDATTSNYFFSEHQKNDVEDFSCAMIGLEGGIEATITAGRCGWQSHPTHGIHDIRLIGSKASLTLDAYAPRLVAFSAGDPWTPPAEPHPEDPMGFWSSTTKASGAAPKTDWQPLQAAAQSDAVCFLDCLESNTPSDLDAGRAAHCVEVIHAVYESASTQQTVRLD